MTKLGVPRLNSVDILLAVTDASSIKEAVSCSEMALAKGTPTSQLIFPQPRTYRPLLRSARFVSVLVSCAASLTCSQVLAEAPYLREHDRIEEVKSVEPVIGPVGAFSIASIDIVSNSRYYF